RNGKEAPGRPQVPRSGNRAAEGRIAARAAAAADDRTRRRDSPGRRDRENQAGHSQGHRIQSALAADAAGAGQLQPGPGGAGRFHLRFGRQNLLHAHNWPTADNNFVNQSFLGPEAITDNGLSLSYVIPPRLMGNQYVELVTEVITGEGDEEQPALNNDAFVDS